MNDEYIESKEELVVELNREPTTEEIEERMADREAARIDAAYEQARVDGQIVFEEQA